MAFVLDGVISQEEIRNLFIAEVNKSLVGQNFLNVETVMDAESIKIWGVGDVAVADYTGSAVTTDATDTSVILKLDQAKYFQKAVDRIDNAQSAIKILSSVLEKGAISTADAIDQYLFSVLGGTTQSITDTALDETNVIKWVSDMSVKLSELGAPKMNRKLAVSPAVGALLAQAGMKIQSDNIATEAGRVGFIGRFYNFDIYETLNLADGASGAGAKLAVATVPEAGYLGIGYQEYELTRPAEGFKDIAKGLANYGAILSQGKFAVKGDFTIA